MRCAMETSDASSAELLRRWNAGDREALSVLLARVLPEVRACVHRRLGPVLRAKADTNDVVQEAVAEFLEHGPRFVVTEERSLAALLGRIALSVLADRSDFFAARRRAVSR